MKARWWAAVGLSALAALGTTGWLWFSTQQKPEKVVIADAHQVLSKLIYVAQAEGLFAQQGVLVDLLTYDNGKTCLQAVIDGAADISLSSTAPVAMALRAGHPLQIFASIHRTEIAEAVVARLDRKITAPGDLKGKRLAVAPGTSAESFLYIFLTDKGLKETDLVIVPLPADQIVQAFVEGKVDAFCGWQALRLTAEKKMPTGLVTFTSTPGLYSESWVLTAPALFVQTRPEVVKRILKALMNAEKVVSEYPGRTEAEVAAYLGLERGAVQNQMLGGNFSVRLDQVLVNNIENSDAIATRGKPGLEPLKTLTGFAVEPLASLDESRVTIIR